MTLEQLKQHIESFPSHHVFDGGLSEPFSWRGQYDEVAFAIVEAPHTREELLDLIQMALTQDFCGWKGGWYNYDESTEVHFEAGPSECSFGSYMDNWNERLSIDFDSAKIQLINTLFPRSHATLLKVITYCWSEDQTSQSKVVGIFNANQLNEAFEQIKAAFKHRTIKLMSERDGNCFLEYKNDPDSERRAEYFYSGDFTIGELLL